MQGTVTGGTFPGADTPFGMVQYSPNNEVPHGGGYNYGRTRTWGFATDHLSGPGCAAMGDVVSLPTTGPVTTVDATQQMSDYSHSDEHASPGYYSVRLATYNVLAELTATTHTALGRFTYPATPQANVVVDPGANLRGTRTSDVHVVGDRTIEGSVSTWGFWNACPAQAYNRYTVYFSMRFSRPFNSFGTGNGARLAPGGRSATGPDAGAWATWDTSGNQQPVVQKVGISFVDLRGARHNLNVESPGYRFEATRTRAHAAWNNMLGRVEISGSTSDRRRAFYSSLYHTMLHPNVFSDVDGRYTGFNNKIYKLPRGRAHYTSFSMWDTYRSGTQVIDLVAPERVHDMMASLLDDQRQSGWVPKWPYAHYDTNEMVGDPAANVVADAVGKGLVKKGVARALYGALIHNATDIPDPARTPLEGRTGIQEYMNLGFVPYRRSGDYTKAGSINMEYGVNDCALALMAGRLKRDGDRRYLLRRSKRFLNSFNGGFARLRDDSGAWMNPFDPAAGTGFKEGTSWQYSWLAPQDVRDLIKAMGGAKATRTKLDYFFQYPTVAANPDSAEAAWTGNDHFNPKNEVSLQAPYLYNYLGQPWKTQEMVRGMDTLYGPGGSGLPSSDDLGTLSGWFVLSSLGLYPMMSGDAHYTLTAPYFPRAIVHIPNAKRALEITAPDAPASYHVAGAAFDGKPLSTSLISHANLLRGGHLAFGLSTQQNFSWAAGRHTPRSVCIANPRTADVRLRLGQGTSSRGPVVRARAVNAGTGPARSIKLRLRLPSGWSIKPAPKPKKGKRKPPKPLPTLNSRRAGAQGWVIRGPHGATGTVRVDATWSGPGGSGAALRTFRTRSITLP